MNLTGGVINAGRMGLEDRLASDARIKQERINALLGQAYGDPSQRQALLGQVAQIDAGAGLQAEEAMMGRDERRTKALGNLSRLALGMPAQARGRFAGDFQRFGVDVNAPDFEQVATGYAQAGGDASGTVHSTFINGNGDRVAIMRDGSERVIGPADTRTQFVDVPGVGPQVVDMRNATSRVVTPGGAASQSGSPQMDALAQQANAMIAAGVPPEKVDEFITRAAQASQGVQVGQSNAGPAWVRPQTEAAADKPPSGYRLSSDGSGLEAIPGGPADKPQAQDKPLPVGALHLQLDASESLSVAQGVDELLSGFESQIEQGLLDLGPAKNLSYQARNAAGASTPQSQAYASFTAGLEKLRNDSLRLNKGVQTDGDAQRAWNELMANINDPGVVKQRLAEIRQINRRGEALQREKMRMIERNYTGKEAAADDDISDLLQQYGDNQ